MPYKFLFLFQKKGDRKLYTQASTESGICLISGGNDKIYKINEIQNSKEINSVSQREYGKILPNHFEMQGKSECKDTEYPQECEDTDSVSQREYSESLPNHFEALENTVDMVEEINRERAENTISVEALVNAREDVPCVSLQDVRTVLTKKESETSDEFGIVLSEANEGHASENGFQAEDNDEAEPKMADQD